MHWLNTGRRQLPPRQFGYPCCSSRQSLQLPAAAAETVAHALLHGRRPMLMMANARGQESQASDALQAGRAVIAHPRWSTRMAPNGWQSWHCQCSAQLGDWQALVSALEWPLPLPLERHSAWLGGALWHSLHDMPRMSCLGVRRTLPFSRKQKQAMGEGGVTARVTGQRGFTELAATCAVGFVCHPLCVGTYVYVCPAPPCGVSSCFALMDCRGSGAGSGAPSSSDQMTTTAESVGYTCLQQQVPLHYIDRLTDCSLQWRCNPPTALFRVRAVGGTGRGRNTGRLPAPVLPNPRTNSRRRHQASSLYVCSACGGCADICLRS